MFERSNIQFPFFEIASKHESIAGRRHIKMVLHEIFPNDQQWQENGISWNEEYTKNNIASVNGMSITVEFLTGDRDVPYSHGITGTRENMPVFEDATMVGFCDKAYIDTLSINGDDKRVLIAEGWLDEMRYPKFIDWLSEHLSDGTVKGSIECVGKKENDGEIIYSGGWKERGRVPQVYDYSGYAILGVKPADEAAIVMELNNKNQKKEDDYMEFTEQMKQEVNAAVSTAMAEVNNRWDEFWAQLSQKDARIAELEAQIKDKEAEIAHVEEEKAQLRADFDAKEAGLTEVNAKLEEANAKIAEMEAKNAELEKEQLKSELNNALASYTDEQRKAAEAEINAFNENPGSVEINAIVGKICTEIVRAAKEAKTSEQNAVSEIDVFAASDMDKTQVVEKPAAEDVNIF